MRFLLPFLFFVVCAPVVAQYQFNGQVSEQFKNKTVHLSLVENYRKNSRVYLDQIFQSVVADSLGHFSFEGDNIPDSNRIYRIHVDACEHKEKKQHHFFGYCPQIESVLFIAQNRDTISLPAGINEQVFCTIVSTNPASDALLQLDGFKEELVVALLEEPTEVAKDLTLRKWLKRFQEGLQASNEPLAELYGYDFLSNRKNETYPYYLDNLKESSFYEELGYRLERKYPNAPFTKQYNKELNADTYLVQAETPATANFPWKYLLSTVLTLSIILIGFLWLKKRKQSFSQNPSEILSPQEQKVLSAILEGKSNKEIGSDLFISLSTVKSHINSVYKKLGMSSRDEILANYKGKT